MDQCYATFPPPAVLAEAGRGWLLKLPLHRNDGLEITYLEHGHVKWVVEDRVMELKGGSIFYAFPWETHGSAEEYEPGHFWHFAVLRGDPAKSSQKTLSFRRLGVDQTSSTKMMGVLEGATRRDWPASSLVVMTIKELVTAAQPKSGPSTTSWNESTLQALGHLLLVELTRIVSEGMAAGGSPTPYTPNIQGVLNQIKVNPEKKWTLASMAAACGSHRTYFTNAIRHETGDTPLVYLRRMRVDKARQMLQTSDASITEIAFACGFETSQHFARIFRHFTGEAASAYRKNSRRA